MDNVISVTAKKDPREVELSFWIRGGLQVEFSTCIEFAAGNNLKINQPEEKNRARSGTVNNG